MNYRMSDREREWEHGRTLAHMFWAFCLAVGIIGGLVVVSVR